MENASETTSETAAETAEPVDLFELSGLELLRTGMKDPALRPGISAFLGMNMITLEEGHVVMEINTRPAYGNPMGAVSGGITATLVDAAMACAVHSALPPRVGYTTVDLALTYLRGIPTDGRAIRAEGRVIHLGERLATAEGRVTDDRDRLVTTATTSCLLLRGD